MTFLGPRASRPRVLGHILLIRAVENAVPGGYRAYANPSGVFPVSIS